MIFVFYSMAESGVHSIRITTTVTKPMRCMRCMQCSCEHDMDVSFTGQGSWSGTDERSYVLRGEDQHH